MPSNQTAYNLLFSGWPSSGGSTQVRIMSILFRMKYIYAGGVLKYWVDATGYDSKSDDINKWQAEYFEHWDRIWEDYVAIQLQTRTNTIFEGKTVGFLSSAPDTFKIFIKADSKTRAGRARDDMRAEDIEKRDKFLQNEWIERFGVDIFDEQLIDQKYDLVIDTTELGIKETAEIVINELHEQKIKNFDLVEMQDNLKTLMTQYNKDSNILKHLLEEKSLLVTPEEIFEDIKLNHQHLLKGLPEKMMVVFK